jgi:cytochrome-b5 reductase
MIRANPAVTSSLFSAARSSVRPSVRSYATAPSSGGSSNLPLYLGLGGIAGLGAYWGLGGLNGSPPKVSGKDVKEALSPTSVSGALSKDKFIDFKLKEVIPYNHDSST